MQVTLELIDAVRNLSFDEALRYLVGTLYPEVLDPLRVPGVVLCVQPHPDDCEFGAGGTIALLGKSGRDIYYVTVTDGRMGTSNPNLYPEELARIRRREQEEAARLLGVRNIIWFDFMDTDVPVNDLRNRLITEIRRLKPSIVIAPDPYTRYEAHSDHINTGKAVLEALILSGLPHVNDVDIRNGLEPHSARLVMLYYTSSPNKYIDIGEVLDLKINALSRHESQFPDRVLLEFLVKVNAMLYGKLAGVSYAEGFKVIPVDLLHVAPFVERI